MKQKQTREELATIAVNDIKDVEAAVHDLGQKMDAKQSKVRS